MYGKRMSAQSAVELIKDGVTVAVVGFTMMGASETVLKELERSFLEEGKPRNLTLFHCAGQSDRIGGLHHFGHKGLTRKVVGAHWGLAPGLSNLIHSNEIEAHCIPQGQAVHLARAMAAGKPGNLSKVGLGTFIDPRVEGGLMNQRSKESGCGIEVMEIGGEEYLFYKAVPIHVAIIRGTTADEFGNVT
ncbi:MAG: acetate CoA-transferase YdiF, partial [Cohnella sp.]|nr:acetate CoA-transferase YdiF [Cohnella sp.]